MLIYLFMHDRLLNLKFCFIDHFFILKDFSDVFPILINFSGDFIVFKQLSNFRLLNSNFHQGPSTSQCYLPPISPFCNYLSSSQRSVSPPTLIKGWKKIICFDIVLPHTIMLWHNTLFIIQCIFSWLFSFCGNIFFINIFWQF
jgi:hypothetical protein